MRVQKQVIAVIVLCKIDNYCYLMNSNNAIMSNIYNTVIKNQCVAFSNNIKFLLDLLKFEWSYVCIKHKNGTLKSSDFETIYLLVCQINDPQLNYVYHTTVANWNENDFQVMTNQIIFIEQILC
jgi:hypothetical protein